MTTEVRDAVTVPGMDPFIESRRIWSDFHLDLAAEIRAHLNARIQPGYYATAVTYVTYDVIEVARSEPRAVSPDVSVWCTALRIPTQGAMAVIDLPPVQSMVPLAAPDPDMPLDLSAIVQAVYERGGYVACHC